MRILFKVGEKRKSKNLRNTTRSGVEFGGYFIMLKM